MSEPFFATDIRYRWRYAGDVLTLQHPDYAAMEIHGLLAGRLCDLLHALETEGRDIHLVLAAIWLTAAAGSAGLVVPAHEAPPEREAP